MKTLKIALCDFRHRTRGLHSQVMPLSIGLMTMYAKSEVKGAKLDVRLYIDAEKYLSEFRDWQPDIVGGSFYYWNRSLTLRVMEKTKSANPETVTILGGPEIESDLHGQQSFHDSYDFIDICVLGEGEKPFVEIVQCVVDNKDPRLKKELKGAFYLHPETKALVVHPPAEKFKDLDEIPSPYTAGLFDEFFAATLHPMIQTTRGCPFACTFCCMALTMHNKVRSHSLERIRADLEYCADKLDGNKGFPLVVCDSNFGMYPQDIPVVKEIRRMQDERGWPRYLLLNIGKNKKERVIETSNILKWGLPAAMSAQSLNDKTLEAIKRKNISLDAMRDMVKGVKRSEAESYTELIFCLPEETLETFEASLKEMIEIGIHRIIIMTLMLLRGTPMAEKESIEKYEFDICYRAIPRAFGTYEGERIIEIEEVVVGTNTMTKDDYLYLRNLQFVLMVVYNSDQFKPIQRFLREIGGDVWEWVREIYRRLEKDKGILGSQLRAFADESSSELFETPQALRDFTQDDGNYADLLSGVRGDNLMNKYHLQALSEAYYEWLNLTTEVAVDIGLRTGVEPEFVKGALSDIHEYQKRVFDVARYFGERPVPDKTEKVQFSFDIHRWMMDRDIKHADCAGTTDYNIWFSEEKIAQMNEIFGRNFEYLQVKQFIFRDRMFDAFTPIIENQKGGRITAVQQGQSSVQLDEM